MQEEGQTNTAESTEGQGGEEEKTHKSSLKGAAPFLSKGQLQSLPKIPHLKSFEHFPASERFQFLGKGTGFKSTGSHFSVFPLDSTGQKLLLRCGFHLPNTVP